MERLNWTEWAELLGASGVWVAPQWLAGVVMTQFPLPLVFCFFNSVATDSEKWSKRKQQKEKRETKGIYLGSEETIGNWETKLRNWSQQEPHNKGKESVKEVGPWGPGPCLLLTHSKPLGSPFFSWASSLPLLKKRKREERLFQVLTSPIWLVATILETADIQQFHHHKNFFGTALL